MNWDMKSVEISSTRNDVRIPPLNVEPLAGKSGSKGVAAETNIKMHTMSCLVTYSNGTF